MKRLDINKGDKFGNFTYLKDIDKHVQPNGQAIRMALCKCVCGRCVEIRVLHLVRNRIHSCGCIILTNASDQIGKKYGSLTVLSHLPNRVVNGREFRWVLVVCDCGIFKECRLSNLKRYTSCGCKTAEIIRERLTDHGMTGTRLYRIWQNMKNRCYNDSVPSFAYYGKIGVKVCKEWVSSNGFRNFYNWAISNGYNDKLTLDRFPDSFGDYKPSNCRFADLFQQANNKRKTVRYNYKGEFLTLSELSKKYLFPYERVRQRLVKFGWDIETAIEKPSQRCS